MIQPRPWPWLGGIIGLGSLLLIGIQPGWTQATTCPADLELLVTQLMADLPAYTNRASRQVLRRSTSLPTRTYLLIAGRPEFEPLPLQPGAAVPTPTPGVHQVFLTTLERQYGQRQVVKRQVYHWLFLAQSERGWRLITMFSSLGTGQPGEPVSPPEESREWAIGQGVQTWLRDCWAGTLR